MAEYTPMVRAFLEEKFDQLLGILSLTEKPDNLLMWSHYAASHEGFVIGFDSNHSYFDHRKSERDEFRWLRKVDYRRDRPNAPLNALDGVDVFLVKSKAWEYEQEWRIMLPIAEATEVVPGEPLPICLFDFPPDAVTEVIIGSRMQEMHKLRLRAILKQRTELANVQVFSSLPNEREFKLDLEICTS
jgi:hypothetical protein